MKLRKEGKMNKVLKKVLTDKKARNLEVLTVAALAVAVVAMPWN